MKTMSLVSNPTRKLISLLIVLSLIQLNAFTQVKELSRHYENYSWSSSEAPESVNASHVIEINGATWLRLHFDEVNLKAGSYLKVKSLEDGGTQKLNAKQLKLWHNSTAYFNGNKVEITLHKSANDPDASIKIIQIEVGDPEPESICGATDDRKASNDKAVGRLVPIGCTGWIIKNGKIVTAGHCAKSSMQVLEFNVPKSSSNGSIKHPAPEHQYTVNQGSVVKGSATSHGTDWAVFKVANNPQTGKSPIQAQGKSFNVVQVNKVKNVRITGYGVDNGSANQTQQTHVGPYSSSNTNKLYYVTDTRGGNSGSPVIDEATGNAIGVHTHGGCSYSGGANSGTNAKRSDFWKAMGLGSNPPVDQLNDIKDLKATVKNCSTVALTWTDNSTGEDGFRVRRKVTGGAYIVLKDVSANSKSYTDNTAKANTKYTYQVRPFKGSTQKTSNLVNVATNSCGSSTAKITITNTITDCNKKGKARNVIFFTVTGSFDKVVASPGSLKDQGNGKYRLRQVGVKFGSTTNYKIAASKSGKTVASETLTVKAVSNCRKSAEINADNKHSVSLFPNPATGEFTVLTEGFNNATFTLMNLSGATILQKSDIENELKLSTDDIPAGVYVVKINDAENSIIERLIIK